MPSGGEEAAGSDQESAGSEAGLIEAFGASHCPQSGTDEEAAAENAVSESGTDEEAAASENKSSASESGTDEEAAAEEPLQKTTKRVTQLQRWGSDTLKFSSFSCSSMPTLADVPADKPTVLTVLTCEVPNCQKSSQDRLALFLITSHARAASIKLRRVS